MADKKFSMDDYVDVAERIQDAADRYPNQGELLGMSFGDPEWGVIEIGGQSFVHCKVPLHRNALDPKPAWGIAWEPFPGRTSFTKDSELMNAHTSAMGRAVIAAGLVANRKLASRQEVRNRVEDQRAAESAPVPAPKPAVAKAVPKLTQEEKQELGALYAATDWTQADLALALVVVEGLKGAEVDALGKTPTAEQYAALIGPAMGALSQAQFEQMRDLLKVAVEKNPATVAA